MPENTSVQAESVIEPAASSVQPTLENTNADDSSLIGASEKSEQETVQASDGNVESRLRRIEEQLSFLPSIDQSLKIIASTVSGIADANQQTAKLPELSEEEQKPEESEMSALKSELQTARDQIASLMEQIKVLTLLVRSSIAGTATNDNSSEASQTEAEGEGKAESADGHTEGPKVEETEFPKDAVNETRGEAGETVESPEALEIPAPPSPQVMKEDSRFGESPAPPEPVAVA